VFGFGTPDAFLVPSVFDAVDWGFGDVVTEDPIVVLDWGFGDVPVLDPSILLFFATLPDDGGEIVSVQADSWPIVGPYKVQLIQHFTGQEFPDSGVAPGATAPLMVLGTGKVRPRGSPYWCYTDIKPKTQGDNPSIIDPGKILTFVLPVVPPGLYDLVISWGVQIYPPPISDTNPLILTHNFHTAMTAERAIRIIYRNRSLQEWRIRSGFPSHYTVGASLGSLETPLTGPGV